MRSEIRSCRKACRFRNSGCRALSCTCECECVAHEVLKVPSQACQRSGRLGKVSQNANKTVDIGPMQVNDTWVKKIAAHWRSSEDAAYLALRDNFCANVEGGAWILRQGLDEAHDDLWEGVALYHSHAEKHKVNYLQQVLAHALLLKKQAAAEMAQAAEGGGR
jgi:hypothetical protein